MREQEKNRKGCQIEKERKKREKEEGGGGPPGSNKPTERGRGDTKTFTRIPTFISILLAASKRNMPALFLSYVSLRSLRPFLILVPILPSNIALSSALVGLGGLARADRNAASFRQFRLDASLPPSFVPF